MTGDRHATLAYLAKLSKIYADFGQVRMLIFDMYFEFKNLTNLHQDFAERLRGY